MISPFFAAFHFAKINASLLDEMVPLFPFGSAALKVKDVTCTGTNLFMFYRTHINGLAAQTALCFM